MMMGDGEVKKFRYCVVGLGSFAQQAILPAFRNAKERCELTALVSGDREKLEHLGKKYRVKNLFTYDEYDQCLQSGLIDAVYIALPNSLHCEYAVRAADAGVHVLCEKPLGVTEDECRRMIEAAERNEVKLMTAYRLHFEEANMEVVEMVASGRIGEPRIFSSVFGMQVRDGNIRTEDELGGGVLPDLGVYCINAARYVFRAEPLRVMGMIANPPDPRFREVDGLTGGLLDFGNGRLANFSVSFGASNTSCYEVVGTEGSIRMNPAYDHKSALAHEVTIGGKTTKKRFTRRDQVAPELIRFAEAVIEDKPVEASGEEGLADVRIIEALYRSAREGRVIDLSPLEKSLRPTMEQEMKRPPVSAPEPYRAEEPKQS